jgi:hypothetical protein
VKRVRRFAPWLVSWPLLLGVWLLLLGARTVAETAVGAVAAAFAAAGIRAVRAGGRERFRLDTAWLTLLPKLPYRLLADCGLVFWELGRRILLRRPLKGRLRAVRFEDGAGGDPRAGSRSALAVWIASFAPNTFALGVDDERNVIVLHELRTRREHPVPPVLARRAR